MSHAVNSPRWMAVAALVAAVVALVAAAGALVIAAQPAPEPSIPPTLTPTPVPNGAMWSIGTGGDGVNPYIEWVAVYPVSSLWNILGAPSLRFTDHAPDDPESPRSFEIGFYKYGPTWHTRNPIVEFWLGGPDSGGGSLSIIGNDQTGGQLEVRNPTDTEHIALDYRDPERPTLRSTHPTRPLSIVSAHGIVSEDTHTFADGIVIPVESQRAGQVRDLAWQDGALTVQTAAAGADSLVIITPLSEPRGRWWVDSVEAGASFTLRSSAPDENMAFNWLLIN